MRTIFSLNPLASGTKCTPIWSATRMLPPGIVGLKILYIFHVSFVVSMPISDIETTIRKVIF